MPEPTEVDLTQDDHLAENTDNAGEPGMPVESQNPNDIPEGSVR